MVGSSREEIGAGRVSVCWRSLGEPVGVAASLPWRSMRGQSDFRRDEEPFSGRSMPEAGVPVARESGWTAPGVPGESHPVRKKSGRTLVLSVEMYRLGR